MNKTIIVTLATLMSITSTVYAAGRSAEGKAKATELRVEMKSERITEESAKRLSTEVVKRISGSNTSGIEAVLKKSSIAVDVALEITAGKIGATSKSALLLSALSKGSQSLALDSASKSNVIVNGLLDYSLSPESYRNALSKSTASNLDKVVDQLISDLNSYKSIDESLRSSYEQLGNKSMNFEEWLQLLIDCLKLKSK